MAKTTRKLTPLGDVLASVLKGRGLSGGLDTAKLQRSWEKATGKTVVKHARPESLDGGRLRVVVDSSAWMNQLSMLAPQILKKLNEVPGCGEVKELRFMLGKPRAGGGPAGAKAEKADDGPRFRALTEQEREGITRALSKVMDEGLRKSIGRLLRASCGRKGKNGLPGG